MEDSRKLSYALSQSMKFKYRLAPLLKIRENVRAEKQAELAKAYEVARIVEAELVRSGELGRQAVSRTELGNREEWESFTT